MDNDFKTVFGITSGFGAVLIWAGFPVITQLAFIQTKLSVSDLTAIRFLVSGFLLLPFVFRVTREQYARFFSDGKHLLFFLLFVSGSGAPYIIVVSSGIQQAEASHFGIIVPSSMMIFTALGARLWLKEPIKRHTIIGNVLILAGIAVIAQASVFQIKSGYLQGDLLLLLGGLLWAGFTLMTRYFGLNPLHSIALVSVASATLFLPYYFYRVSVNEATAAFWTQPWQAVTIQAIYQGVLLSIVALVLYSIAVVKLGAAKGSLFAAGLPGLTLLLTSFLPGQHISANELVGAVIVTGGMLISLNILKRPR